MNENKVSDERRDSTTPQLNGCTLYDNKVADGGNRDIAFSDASSSTNIQQVMHTGSESAEAEPEKREPNADPKIHPNKVHKRRSSSAGE